MRKKFKKIKNRLKRTYKHNIEKRIIKIFTKDFEVFEKSILPKKDQRWGVASRKDNESYIRSAEHEVSKLVEYYNISNTSNILDVGCGQGRLAIGLIRTFRDVQYHGIDVHKPSIQWCRKHISKKHPNFNFTHFNLQNERYNKEGKLIDSDFSFSKFLPNYNVIYLFSVFTHMEEKDMKIYMKNFSEMLSDGSGLFLTAFVEEGVENCKVNPDNFHFSMRQPLHVVLYNREYFLSILEEYGFSVINIEPAAQTCTGHYAFYLKKISKPIFL